MKNPITATAAIAVWLLVATTGCSNVGVGVSLEVSGGSDAGGFGAEQDSVLAPEDVLSELTFEELDPQELVLPGDLGVDDVAMGPLPGEPGHPCESDADCDSEFCIQTAAGKQCTLVCDEECPFGWECMLYQALLPDMVSICVPSHLDLCRPCQTNADCWANQADGGEKCVPAGDAGSFCGMPCLEADDCPEGFGCVEVEDVTGAVVNQCVLEEGECECQLWHADHGAMTTCHVTNEWGVCDGERFCLAEGLTECSAPEPAAESCNGVDDDCDGSVDEETGGGECFNTSPHGMCPGVEECDSGALVCEGPWA